MADRTRFVLLLLIVSNLLAGSAASNAQTEVLQHGGNRDGREALADLSAATTLVMVQTDPSGLPVLRYVRGRADYLSGSNMSQPQPVGLESVADFGPDNAPSILRHGGILAVAHRVGQTIHFRSSGYATRLAQDQDNPPPSQLVLASDPFGPMSSRVQLARAGKSLFVTWRSGITLRAIASHDGGKSWSAPYTLVATPVYQNYAVASDLSAGADGLLVVRVRPTGKARAVQAYWLSKPTASSQPVFQVLSPAINVYSGIGEIQDVSIARDGGKVFIAYARSNRIDVSRYDYSTRAFEATSTIVNYLPVSYQREIRAVTIQPSPYGWACQWVEASTLPGPLRYFTYGLLSADGLNYPSTPQWSYHAASVSNVGPTSMTTTPVPTPWIWKYHDSGRSAEAAFNLVITGDGYTYSERNLFFEHAKTMADRILTVTPLAENGDLYNIWIVAAYSKHSGHDTRDPSNCAIVQERRDTIFDSWTCGSTDFDYLVSRHSRRMLAGLSPWSATTAPAVRTIGLVNQSSSGTSGITTWFGGAVPVGTASDGGQRLYASIAPLHEGLHGNLFAHPDFSGNRFAADQDLYIEDVSGVNVSSTSGLAAHPWAYWFTTEGSAPSVQAQLSDDYRAHRSLGRFSCGNDVFAWFFADPSCSVLQTDGHPALQPGSGCTPGPGGFQADQCMQMGIPFTSNPFVGAWRIDGLSYFNPGLFELQEHLGYSGTIRWYTSSYAGVMYSRTHKSFFLDPVTAEGIVESLERWATGSYSSDGFRNAGGATLAFHLLRMDSTHYGSQTKDMAPWQFIFPWGTQSTCPAELDAASASLETLGSSLVVQVGATDYRLSDMSIARWDQFGVDNYAVATLPLPDTPVGTPVSVQFRSTNAGADAPPAWLWIPGIQIVNQRGARYAMHPDTSHVSALQAKTAGMCDFEVWDLHADGPLTISYISKGPKSP